jgi:hypothetical protein
LEEIKVEGIVSREGNQYILTTDDGKRYELLVIMPWEAVSPDYGTEDFALHLGKRMVATGMTDGNAIWKAHLTSATHN